MAVCEFGSFTDAAKHAAQSLSVVSRNIAMLKDAVGQELFVKVDNRQEMTEAGEMLYEFIKTTDDLTSDFIDGLSDNQAAMEGMVRYAMPPSCLQSPHFPMLLERRLEFPLIELKVELTSSDRVVESVLANQFDFGFVTEKVAHPQLNYQPFCEEEYVLVSNDPADFVDLSSESLLKKRFIAYPGMEVPFDLWVRHYLPEEKNLTARSLYHAGEINDIVGAIKMVMGGLGISAFPRHCVEAHLESGELYAYASDENPYTLTNFIYIVSRANPPLSRRVQAVIRWFLDMHPEYEAARSQSS